MAAAAAPSPAVALNTAYDAKLTLATGGDDLSEANLDNSGLGITLSLSQNHWLRKAAGGAATVTWHEMETACAAAVYFDGDNLALPVASHALSLQTMADVARAAINKGYAPDDQGGMTEALYHFTAFVRDVRSQAQAEFAVDDATAFDTLPALPGAR